MNREIAYSLVRITYDVIFVTTGTSKFLLGLSNFVGGMNQRFSGKLPAIVVMPFAFAIPFEAFAGVLILIGLFTRVGLTLTGLLLIGLTFGVTWLGDALRRGAVVYRCFTTVFRYQHGMIGEARDRTKS